MDAEFIIRHRLQSQLLTAPVKSAVKAVHHMVAMQAQAFSMSRMAIALRCDAGEEGVIKALDSGKLLRTHLLRPTWHIVAAEDIRPLLRISRERILRSMDARHNELGLRKATIDKAMKVIRKALADGELSRAELVDRLSKERISTTENRTSHLLMIAELDEIVCSGTVHGTRQNYDLLDRKVKGHKSKSNDIVIRELALRYIQSRGPATLQDFTWWSGLSPAAARDALAHVAGKLGAEHFEKQDYYWSAHRAQLPAVPELMLLPSYDEWLISYKNRSASLQLEHHRKSVSTNGIFFPVVLHHGKVVGNWKIVKGKCDISFFGKAPAGLKQKAQRYAEQKKLIRNDE